MTTFTQSDIILNYGEVHIVGYGVSTPESYYYNADLKSCQQYRCEYGENKMLLYTTNRNYTTVNHLNRNHFVKPVDVEELAIEKAFEYTTFDQAAWTYAAGFKAGYNANKAEFTLEHLEKAFEYGVTFGANGKDNFNDFYKKLRPLSLPKSITIQNDEIINVEW